MTFESGTENTEFGFLFLNFDVVSQILWQMRNGNILNRFTAAGIRKNELDLVPLKLLRIFQILKSIAIFNSDSVAISFIFLLYCLKVKKNLYNLLNILEMRIQQI